MSALGWGLGIIGGAAAVVGITYVATRPAKAAEKPQPKPNPNGTPQAPVGYAWKPVVQNDAGGSIPKDAYVLLEWNDQSNSTSATLASWLQTKGQYTVYAAWDRGVVPDGWPGSTDATMSRFYAKSNVIFQWPKDYPNTPGLNVYGVLKG